MSHQLKHIMDFRNFHGYVLFKTNKIEKSNVLKVFLYCPNSQILIKTFEIKRLLGSTYVGFFPHSYRGPWASDLKLMSAKNCFFNLYSKLFFYFIFSLKKWDILGIFKLLIDLICYRKIKLRGVIRDYFKVKEISHQYKIVSESKFLIETEIREEDLLIVAFNGSRNLLTKQVCYFSHYDPNCTVDPYVLNYLDALLKVGFSIVFISTCHSLDRKSLIQLESRCYKIILRKNFGLDFGSWALGLLSVPVNNDSILLFANDSVFGPIFDLEEVMTRYKKSGRRFIRNYRFI